jgi:hypothetical protein
MTYNQPPEQARKKKSSALWNLMTFLVVLAIGLLVWYFATLWRNPRFLLNPFPPEPSATVFFTETPTITPIQQPPTWTPSITIQPTASRTRAYTWTPLDFVPSETFTLTPIDTLTPSITSTPMPASAEITYHPSTDVHPSSGCDWMGIGGTVLGLDGEPLQFQSIQLGGELGEVIISQLRLSGSAPDYGSSGFEFELGTKPVGSTQTLWIQLFDNTNKALTEKIYFDTFDDCERNLVKVAFKRNR